MTEINPGIFKAYDIRGTYPDEIDEETVLMLGRAFAQFLGEDKVVVGRDMRHSSPALSGAFCSGLNEQGVDAVDIGLCSTDELYFASGRLDLSGVMFTASHNPKEYNGMKLCRRKAAPISIDTGIAEIRDLAIKGRFVPAARRGVVVGHPMLDEYVRHVLSFIDISNVSPIKVVVDAGNGMAGLIAPPVFKQLPVELVPKCFELDGSFPHHQPSPIEAENIELLSNWVKEEKADLGMAFDGDADRCFLVDDQGEPVSGALTNALIAKRILQRSPGEKVIYNVINSWVVPETIREYGGIPIRERVGHSFIKETMAQTGAIYGGEHSGHYYFRDNFRADSGMIAGLYILEIIGLDGRPLSEILKPFKKYSGSGEINSEVSDKQGKIDELADRYSDGAIDLLDGITVEYDDWWFNVRPSNTEPLLRLNVEAKGHKLMEEKRDELLRLIRA